MSTDLTCCVCGRPLDDPAIPGLCPRCLLQDAIGSPEFRDVAVADSSTPVSTPHRIGDYELLEVLGRGGMGIVYKARQISLGRMVALKMILTGRFASEAEVRRFCTEAEAAANLEHPHIVPIYGVGSHEGQHYFTMKLIEGGTLARQIHQFAGKPRLAVQLLLRIAQAVHYAHQHGVLHRDLKPSNILVNAEGQPYVSDFGLARHVTAQSFVTLSGQVLGTPNYMAPEQAAGSHKQLSVAVDVYGLGAILYELLTGQPPFSGETALATLQQVREVAPKRPSAITRAVDADLETICLKCLERDPQRRYVSAGALAEDLERWLEGRTILARRVGQAGKLWRWCRRKPLVAGLAAALILVFAVGFAGIVWQWRRAVAGEQRAVAGERRAVAGELTSRRNAYDADMMVVQQALAEGDLGWASSLLQRNVPLPGQEDLRGWEWRYRWQQCQPSPAFLGELLKPPRPDIVPHLSFSPDGKWLAAGCDDGWVGLLELGQETWQTLQESSQAKAIVAFAPQVNRLAFTRFDGINGTIVLWDTANHKEDRLITFPHAAYSLVFSPDARLLIAGLSSDTWPTDASTGQYIRVWDLHSGNLAPTELAKLANSPWDGAREGALAMARDGSRIVFGDGHGYVHVASLPQLQEQPPFKAHDETISAIALSPDGSLLATGSRVSDPIVRLWDARTGEKVGELAGHNRYIHGLAFSPKGNVLASASADRSIRLWDVRTRKEISHLQGHHQEVFTAVFSSDGETLASGCKDGSILLWSTAAQDRQDPQILNKPEQRVSWYSCLPDGRSLAVITSSGQVCLWDTADMKPKGEALPIPGTPRMVTSSSDGRFLVIGGFDGRVRVWDMNQRRLLRDDPASPDNGPGKSAPATDWVWARFSPDNRKLVTTVLLQTPVQMTVRDTSTWEILVSSSFGRQSCCADISPDSQFLAVGCAGGEVIVLDLRTGGIERALPHHGIIFGVAFSHDGATLATASLDGSLMLWDTRTWRPLCEPLKAHQLATFSVSFSHDDKRMLTTGGCGEEAVVVWDVATRRQVAALRGEGSAFWPADFSPDENTIIAKPDEGRLHIWRAPSAKQVAASQAAGGRSVSTP